MIQGMSTTATATVRQERHDDHEAVARVVGAAFGSAAEARLVEAVRSSVYALPELTLVAEIDDAVVGHVMISYVPLEGSCSRRLVPSLSPLAVAPDHQGRGIGSRLVREATERADEAGEPLVVLEGSPAYYGRLGFEHSVPHGIHIDLPDWAPPEAAQVKRLGAYDPAIRGRVAYPQAFDEVASH